MVGPEEGRHSQHPRRFIASLSTHVGMGCARWTYEPKEAVLKSAPRMDWVERLLFFAAGKETDKSEFIGLISLHHAEPGHLY